MSFYISLLLCGLDSLFSLWFFWWSGIVAVCNMQIKQFQITIFDFRTISRLASDPKMFHFCYIYICIYLGLISVYFYFHSKQQSWHRVYTNSLLLVLRTCQTAFLLFRSHLTQQMERRGELWLDWQKTGGGFKKKMPRLWEKRVNLKEIHSRWSCSFARCLGWRWLGPPASAVRETERQRSRMKTTFSVAQTFTAGQMSHSVN